MAASKTKPYFRFLPTQSYTSIASDSAFDFDESDVWNSSDPSPPRPLSSSSSSETRTTKMKKKNKSVAVAGGTAASVPINVPDWSKILKNELHGEKRRCESDEDEDGDGGGGGDLIPPHEFLAKKKQGRRVAFSVYEGIGRTLKGRDLSSVRDAIWEKTGFQH